MLGVSQRNPETHLGMALMWRRPRGRLARPGPSLAGPPGPVLGAHALLSPPPEACSPGCRLRAQAGGLSVESVVGVLRAWAVHPLQAGSTVRGPRAPIPSIPGSLPMAVIIPMPRQGDRSPSLLLPPRVPLLQNPSLLLPLPWVGGLGEGLQVRRPRSQDGQAGPFSKLRCVRCLSPGGGPSGPRAERRAGGPSAHATPDTPVARPCPWALRLPAPPDLSCPFSGLTGLSQAVGFPCPHTACHEDLGRQVARSQPLPPRGTVQPAPAGRCRRRTVPHLPRTPGAGRRPSPVPGSRIRKTHPVKPPPWCAPRRALSAAVGSCIPPPMDPQAWQALGGRGRVVALRKSWGARAQAA